MGASTSILLKSVRGDWVKQYVRWPTESLTAVTDQYVDALKLKGPIAGSEDPDTPPWTPQLSRAEWFQVSSVCCPAFPAPTYLVRPLAPPTHTHAYLVRPLARPTHTYLVQPLAPRCITTTISTAGRVWSWRSLIVVRRVGS